MLDHATAAQPSFLYNQRIAWKTAGAIERHVAPNGQADVYDQRQAYDVCDAAPQTRSLPKVLKAKHPRLHAFIVFAPRSICRTRHSGSRKGKRVEAHPLQAD
jgi:hypothetical protein